MRTFVWISVIGALAAACEAPPVAPAHSCGNGVVEEGEHCDDGVFNGAGVCPPGCFISDEDTVCGDGFISGGELCDDGVNAGGYEGCRPGCQALGPRCGDNLVQLDAGEICDDGDNSGDYGGCDKCAQLAPSCGDSVVDSAFGELCDDGINDGVYGGCANDCFALAGVCGDARIEPGVEACDDGINDGRAGGCAFDCSFRPGAILFSEIMYNPVGRDDFVERHEFLELFNPAPADEDLGGWRLTGGIEFTFPAGSVIGASGFVVVAGDLAAFNTVYPGAEATGPFAGALGNGGDELILVRPDGTISDRVIYDDDAPWPRGADGLGADERWLPEVSDLDEVRFRGRSLERVSFTSASNRPENWVASELPAGPSPGATNPQAREVPLDVVLDFAAVPVSGNALVRAGDEVLVEVLFSSSGEVSGVLLEFFVDDVARADETINAIPMTALGANRFSATLPAVNERDIVRWRVVGDRGVGLEIIEPRTTDAERWHAYFAQPDHSSTTTSTYELFISPNNWTQLWNQIQGGRVNVCAVRDEWQRTVPAVFVYEGQVYDVEVRHQGSRYQRTNGPQISNWPFPGPSQPSPLRALSWSISFPDYAPFGERDRILLNKLQQGCSGVYQGVGFALFRDIGVPTPDVNYARFFINGGYYNYVLQLDHMSERTLERHHADLAARNGTTPEEIGHLFKVKGIHAEEGPWGTGDGRQLVDGCGYDARQRYEHTFDRKSHGWASHDELIALVDELHLARGESDDALRAYLDANWDVPVMLDYLALMNWLGPWDDVFHNYYIYQHRDGRWVLAPWDLDLSFGNFHGNRTNTSIYIGKDADPDNRNGWWNYFKDAFFRAYPAEYEAALRELNQTLLEPSVVQARIDAWQSSAEVADANASAAGTQCNFDSRADTTRTWVQGRHDFIEGLLGN